VVFFIALQRVEARQVHEAKAQNGEVDQRFRRVQRREEPLYLGGCIT
jgi:hypothetical protein